MLVLAWFILPKLPVKPGASEPWLDTGHAYIEALFGKALLLATENTSPPTFVSLFPLFNMLFTPWLRAVLAIGCFTALSIAVSPSSSSSDAGSIASGDDGPEALGHLSDHRESLQKRAGRNPWSDTIDYYEYLFTRNPRPQPTPPGLLDEYYADTLHYGRTPVFLAREGKVDMARQALVDHGSFWIVGDPVRSRDEPIPAFRRLANGQKVTEEKEAVLDRLYQARHFGEAHGDLAKRLAFGAPFAPARRRTPSGADLTWQEVRQNAITLNTNEIDIRQARAQLAQHGMLKLHNPDTGSTIGYKLNEEGEVLVSVFSRAGRHLAKRGFNWTPSQIEYYTQTYKEDPTLKPLPRAARGPYYADVIFYQGYPVFFPTGDPTAIQRSKQALQDFGKFYVPASADGAPGDKIFLAVSKGGKVRAANAQGGIWALLMRADSRRYPMDPVEKALTLGPSFSKRKRPSGFWGWLRGYRTPKFQEVVQTADVVDAQNARIPDVWTKLENQGRLVVKNGESYTAYVLDKSGRVLTHKF